MLESKKRMYESEKIFKASRLYMHNAKRSNQRITENDTAYAANHASALLFHRHLIAIYCYTKHFSYTHGGELEDAEQERVLYCVSSGCNITSVPGIHIVAICGNTVGIPLSEPTRCGNSISFMRDGCLWYAPHVVAPLACIFGLGLLNEVEYPFVLVNAFHLGNTGKVCLGRRKPTGQKNRVSPEHTISRT